MIYLLKFKQIAFAKGVKRLNLVPDDFCRAVWLLSPTKTKGLETMKNEITREDFSHLMRRQNDIYAALVAILAELQNEKELDDYARKGKAREAIRIARDHLDKEPHSRFL